MPHGPGYKRGTRAGCARRYRMLGARGTGRAHPAPWAGCGTGRAHPAAWAGYGGEYVVCGGLILCTQGSDQASHGMASHGMASHGMAWHRMASHGIAWHGMAWHRMGVTEGHDERCYHLGGWVRQGRQGVAVRATKAGIREHQWGPCTQRERMGDEVGVDGTPVNCGRGWDPCKLWAWMGPSPRTYADILLKASSGHPQAIHRAEASSAIACD